MSESTDHAWLRAGLNRLMGMKVIDSWDMQSSKNGTVWDIRINDTLALSKSTGSAKAFVHGAMAASAATIDQKAAARVLSDATIRLEAKRRGMKVLEIVQ